MSNISAERLEKLYHQENLSQREIAEKIGVSQPAISKWMKKYGINSKNSPKWTEEDIKLLKEHYPSSREKFDDLFPERTWNAVKLKAMNLGLSKTAEEHRKSESNLKRLRKLSEDHAINVDYEATSSISYVLGVIDGDGYTDRKGTVGLEVKDQVFADKFVRNLKSIGLNPNTGTRRGKITVWASSKELVEWVIDLEEKKLNWLLEEGDSWRYIEGQYDSDGNLHPCGSPRICSYDEKEKEFLHGLLSKLEINCNIQQNNVWVSKTSSEEFFKNINPVLERRRPS